MKFQKFLFAALAMVAIVGCDNAEDEVEDGKVYTISADKQTVESDGKDVVTFTITDQNGVDVTADSKQLKTIYLFEENAGTSSKGVRTFSSFRDGDFTFYAKVKGVRTKNSVSVKAQNRKLYEKYQHKILAFQLTGTWCPNCPSMTAALHEVKEGEYGDNVIILGTHGSSAAQSDPYAVAWGDRDLGTEMLVKFNFGGMPYAVYDMAVGNGSRVPTAINALLEKLMLNNPATCGVKISKAEVSDDGNVKIEASVKSHKGGTYDLAYAVLADNQPKLTGNEDIYHDVVRAVSDNFFGMSDTKVTLDAEEEHTQTWEFKLEPLNNVPFKASDYKVVVFAYNEEMIDNANICAANSSVDYILTK